MGEMPDSIVGMVCDDLRARSNRGKEKYGVTLDRKDLTPRQWLQHAYEETLDQANYLKKFIVELADIDELVSTSRLYSKAELLTRLALAIKRAEAAEAAGRAALAERAKD